MMDPVQLDQILVNTAVNARDAMPNAAGLRSPPIKRISRTAKRGNAAIL
jgi:C4-dicarboxylate-specific signal transduction histidine kinase